MHITGRTAQHSVQDNIRHPYQELGRDRIRLEVVMHEAVLSLDEITAAFGEELARLKTDFGVQYTACSNTMKVTREDLISKVGDTVPVMVRLMGRQEQGWIYNKSYRRAMSSYLNSKRTYGTKEQGVSLSDRCEVD